MIFSLPGYKTDKETMVDASLKAALSRAGALLPASAVRATGEEGDWESLSESISREWEEHVKNG